MKKGLLATLLVACGLTLQAFGAAPVPADAFGTGSYQTIGSCICGGQDQVKTGTVKFSFNFNVNNSGPCGPATGEITLADSGCKVRLKGVITKLESYVVSATGNQGAQGEGVAVVYGVVTSGKLKGEFFRLELSGGELASSSSFAFRIVSDLCVDDCPGYKTGAILLPPGTISLSVFP